MEAVLSTTSGPAPNPADPVSNPAPNSALVSADLVANAAGAVPSPSSTVSTPAGPALISTSSAPSPSSTVSSPAGPASISADLVANAADSVPSPSSTVSSPAGPALISAGSAPSPSSTASTQASPAPSPTSTASTQVSPSSTVSTEASPAPSPSSTVSTPAGPASTPTSSASTPSSTVSTPASPDSTPSCTVSTQAGPALIAADLIANPAGSAPNPTCTASTPAPNPPLVEQLHALAELNSAIPEWLTCLMKCKKRVGRDQEVVSAGCGHIICSDACLKKLRKKHPGEDEKMKCPSCLITLKESVLKNKIIVKDAFPFKPTKDTVVLICGICVFNNEAVSYCGDCPSYLCKKCDDLHPTLRLTKTHTTTRDLSERKEFELNRLIKENSICQGHADEPEPPPADEISVTHNCKRCKLRICKLCAHKHRSQKHEVVDVGARRSRLIRRMKQTAELLAKVESGRDRLAHKKNVQLREYWYPIFTELNREFSVFAGKVTKQCLDRKQEVSNLYSSATEDMDQRLKKIQIYREQIERYVEVAKALRDEGDDQSILHLTSVLSPLGAKLAEVNNALHDIENFTFADHRFTMSNTWCKDVELCMDEMAEVNYVNPIQDPAYSLGFDCIADDSVRLSDDNGVDNIVEKFKEALKDIEKEREEMKQTRKAKRTQEAEENSVTKTTEILATRKKAAEVVGKKAKEEAARKKAKEEAARKKAKEEATRKKTEAEAQNQMKRGEVQMEVEESNALPIQKRVGKRKRVYGGNNRARAKKPKIGGRSKSPSMPRLKPQASTGRPVGRPRKNGRGRAPRR